MRIKAEVADRANAVRRPWPARVGLAAAAFVLASVAVIAMLVLVWSVLAVVFSASVGYAVSALVAAPVSVLAAAGSVWISKPHQVSALWGILGVVVGILSPGILLAVTTVSWLIFGWPTVGD